jgi:hypothetical protein
MDKDRKPDPFAALNTALDRLSPAQRNLVRTLTLTTITARNADEGCLIGRTNDGRACVYLVQSREKDPVSPEDYAAWGILDDMPAREPDATRARHEAVMWGTVREFYPAEVGTPRAVEAMRAGLRIAPDPDATAAIRAASDTMRDAGARLDELHRLLTEARTTAMQLAEQLVIERDERGRAADRATRARAALRSINGVLVASDGSVEDDVAAVGAISDILGEVEDLLSDNPVRVVRHGSES